MSRNQVGSPPVKFVKVYEPGIDRIDQLLALPRGRLIGKLWLWLVRNVGRENAIVVSRDVLAEALGVTVKSVSDATAALVQQDALFVFKTGTSNVYVLNPRETSRVAEDHEFFVSFGAKVLLGVNENPDLRRRMRQFFADRAPTSEGSSSLIDDPRQRSLSVDIPGGL